MNKIIMAKSYIIDILLCTVTGLLTAFAFPKINFYPLIWISFLPIISVIMSNNPKKAFFYGFYSGFIFNMLELYWITLVLKTQLAYIYSILMSSILWSYLALYWGIWSIIISFFKEKIKYKLLLIIFGSCVWILLEYIRTYFLTGFSWGLIGYSQFKFIWLIQLVEFTGVYGISFLIILSNFILYFFLKKYIYFKLVYYKLFYYNFYTENNNYVYLNIINNKLKFSCFDLLHIFVILFFLILMFGVIRYNKFNNLSINKQKYSVAIIQPNISQQEKWNKNYINNILNIFKNYSYKINRKYDLILWPETAIPRLIFREQILFNTIKHITNIFGGINIIGSLYKNNDGNLFNVVIAFAKNKCLRKLHKKNHLVIFGEYVPLNFIFQKFFRLFNISENFTAGTDSNIFNYNNLKIGSMICSENFTPIVCRKFIFSGAKVISNHTNDAWFFNTSAPYQHFIMNIFRAIEIRKTILISANSGISGIIDDKGNIIKKSKVLNKSLIIGHFKQNNFNTFYAKHGDFFIFCCFLFIIIVSFFTLFQ
ncbi:MAG: apolipoprotein N-acyltransferase [Endomicrobium sp.]|jgi:apolipoprotein N-acyltransferase|nr:apolipoprotein N-acyltransferase [Endomicrobium sp.]